MADRTVENHQPAEPGNPRINVRFLWILMALGLIIVVGGASLHHHQLRRNAGMLRQNMVALRERGKINEAIRAYNQFLMIFPDDADALEELGELLSENARSSEMLLRAYLTLETVLRQDAERDSARLRLVELSIKLRRFTDALNHVRILRGDSPADPELAFQEGKCHEGLGRYREAAKLYSESIALSDETIDFYERLTNLILQRSNDLNLKEIDPLSRDYTSAGEVAAEIMDNAVEKGRPAYRAYLARADFHRTQQNLDAAESDIGEALQLAETDIDVLLVAAQLALDRADFAAVSGNSAEASRFRELASEYANRGIDRDLRQSLILSRVSVDTGNTQEAIALLYEVRERIPEMLKLAIGRKLTETLVTEQLILFMLADLLISQVITEIDSVSGDPFQESRNLMDSMQKTSSVEPLFVFLQARIYAGKRQWNEAARAFEQARHGPHPLVNVVRRIDLQLSVCYKALESPNARILALRRAVAADPFWPGGRMELSGALADAGRIDEAVDEYRKLTRISGVRLMLARLLILQQAVRPADRRDWSEASRIIASARQALPDVPQVPVLEAELLAQQKKFGRAMAVLEEGRDRFPDAVAIPAAQSVLALMRPDAENASRIETALNFLDAATVQLGRNVELDLARAKVAAETGGIDGQRLLQEIGNSVSYDTDGQVQLYAGLARTADVLKAPQLAVGFWKRVTDLRPSHLLAHREIAQQSRKDEAVRQSALAAIRRIEGPEGPNGDFVEATSLVEHLRADSSPITVDSPRMKDVTTARRLLARAAVNRSEWAVVPRAQGELERISGNADDAFRLFRTAMELGDRSRELVMLVVRGYMERKRFEEADQVLVELAETQPELISGELARMAWAVAWQQNQFDRALGVADRVADKSKNFRDQIWLSELRFARGQRGPDVEQPLDEAIRQAPSAPEPWFAKVTYLLRIGRIDDADATIEHAAASIRPDDAGMTVARCYELISEFSSIENHYIAKAEKYYLEALDSAPDGDVRRIIAVADFYSRHADFAQATELLDRLLDPQTAAPNFAVAWARRRQAMLIASRGDYDDSTRALELLKLNEKQGTESDVSDLRTRAEILARRHNRKDRLAAIQIFEELGQRQQIETTDVFRLAGLYDVTGDWQNTRRVMLDLVTADSPDPAHIAFFVERLTRKDELNEARLWMNKLEKLQPKAVRTVLTKARLLGTLNRSAEAAALVTNFLVDRRQVLFGLSELLDQENADETLQMMKEWLQAHSGFKTGRILGQAQELIRQRQVAEAIALLREHVKQQDLADAVHATITRVAASLLEEIGELGAAEDLFRQYANLSTQPAAVFILAKFLARNDQVGEALTVCEKHLGAAAPELVATGTVSVVSQGDTTSDHLQQVDEWIMVAIEQKPESLACLVALADLRLLQRRLGEAEELYRMVLTKNDKNLVALNNLAWLLTHVEGRSTQALDLINRAIELAGRQAALLDTRAMVYLSIGKAHEALEDLHEVYEGTDSAIGNLHLAIAHLLADDTEMAAAAMAEAERCGLRANSLHPLEREKLERVRKALDRYRRYGKNRQILPKLLDPSNLYLYPEHSADMYFVNAFCQGSFLNVCSFDTILLRCPLCVDRRRLIC